MKKCSCCRKEIKETNKSSKGKRYRTCSQCRKDRRNKKHNKITIERGLWKIDWAGYGKIIKVNPAEKDKEKQTDLDSEDISS